MSKVGGHIGEGELLYSPSEERVAAARLSAFSRFLAEERGLEFADYDALWRYSTADLEGFWAACASFSGVSFSRQPEEILVPETRPDGVLSAERAKWFVGAELNYVDAVFRHDPARPAVVARDERGGRLQLSYGELEALVAKVAASLVDRGVARGDRVAAVLTNGIEAIATFLATASLGAVFSSCAPEFGAPSMVDRFSQISPKVLVGMPSYHYGGRDFPLADKLASLADALPQARVVTFEDLSSGSFQPPLDPVQVGFSDPLWVLYSSGTTGLPKAIVHGHGGIVLEHLKALLLQSDIGPGDRFFWYSTTGWMMWNYLVGGLLAGATVIAYDGSAMHPEPISLWRMAAEEKVTHFGTSAPYIEACRKAGVMPRNDLDLSSLHSIGSTGAPLPPEGFAWASRCVADDVAVASVSGGTDVCTAFLAASPWLPVYAGELQCAALGAKVEAYGPDASPVVGEVGELVVETPMPSMPIALWADPDGSRLHEAYFAEYPGRWRHGDWVKRTERGTYVVYGRSDATLNRGGVRMGTAEFYRVVEALPEIRDSLVIDTSELGREGELVLLVVSEDSELSRLEGAIRAALREKLSPRHVPDRVLVVRALPRTLNGKKVEVPLRRILLGTPVDTAVSADSLADPTALEDVLEALRRAGMLSPYTSSI